EAVHLAPTDLEVETVEGDDVAVGLAEVADLDDGRVEIPHGCGHEVPSGRWVCWRGQAWACSRAGGSPTYIRYSSSIRRSARKPCVNSSRSGRVVESRCRRRHATSSSPSRGASRDSRSARLPSALSVR